MNIKTFAILHLFCWYCIDIALSKSNISYYKEIMWIIDQQHFQKSNTNPLLSESKFRSNYIRVVRFDIVPLSYDTTLKIKMKT